ncbi:hypothetical protein ACFL7M_08225 [Thermodesulfobacteriota bacterium]
MTETSTYLTVSILKERLYGLSAEEPSIKPKLADLFLEFFSRQSEKTGE